MLTGSQHAGEGPAHHPCCLPTLAGCYVRSVLSCCDASTSYAHSAGSIWAWVVSSTVWRYEARREMRGGLSELFLNIAWRASSRCLGADAQLSSDAQYTKSWSERTRPVRSHCWANSPRLSWRTAPVELTRPPSMRDVNDASERTSLLTPAARQRLSAMTNEFVEMELHLQRELIEVRLLFVQVIMSMRCGCSFTASSRKRCENPVSRDLSLSPSTEMSSAPAKLCSTPFIR